MNKDKELITPIIQLSELKRILSNDKNPTPLIQRPELKRIKTNLTIITSDLNRLEYDYENLQALCKKLLNELDRRILIEDQPDSSLPEWRREAEKLGIVL